MSRRTYGMVLCLVSPLVVAGCQPDPLSAAAKRHLELGADEYEAGNDTAVIAHMDAVLREADRGDNAAQAYYLRGMSLYRKGEIDDARSDLRRGEGKARSTALYIRILDALGELAYQHGPTDEAMRRFRDVIELSELGARPTDHAHYRLACLLQRQGKWTDADLHLNRVIDQFGRTKLAAQSRGRVHGRAWTVQVGSYRTKRNADAAAIRFRDWFDTHVEPVVRKGELVFLLQAGRWDTYEAAAVALKGVRRHKSDAFLSVTR